MASDPSRWWVAMLPFPVLVALRYVLVWLTTLLLPSAGPTRAEALPVLLLGVGSSLVGALVVVTAPLFAAGVLLDVRTLRTRSSWRPHWGYGALGLFPVLGIFVEWVALLSIPAAIGYLELRRRSVGYPRGREQPPDAATRTGAVTSSAHASPSGWWYGVVIPPVLELAGAGLLWTVRTTGLLGQGSAPLTLLVPVALTLVAVGFVPLFAVSLYFDAKTVSDASSESGPAPRVWGLLGIGSLAGLLLFRITFMPIVAGSYVWRRRQARGP